MPFKSLTKIMCVLTLTAIPGGSLLAAGSAGPLCTCVSETADWNFPSEASQLLEEIRSASHRLTDNTANLKSFGRGGMSWQSHAGELMLIKEQINSVGERIQRLQAIRHVVAPWQQEAIDSVRPIALILAARAEAAIRHLNENQTYLWSETYQDHLTTLTTRAGQMKKSVTLHLELAETQEKLEALRTRVASIGS